MKETEGGERICENFIREGERERVIKKLLFFLSSCYNELFYIAVYCIMLLKKFRYNTINKAWFLRF